MGMRVRVSTFLASAQVSQRESDFADVSLKLARMQTVLDRALG